MAESFFDRLDAAAMRALLGRTVPRDTALFLVGPTMNIQNCTEGAARLAGLRPLERLDPLLSETACAAVRECLTEHIPRTVSEELDGVYYRLEIVPHKDGALLAFLREDGAQYDGSLRVLQAKGAQYLGGMLGCIEQMEDKDAAAVLRRQCLRMQRMFSHSDFLHDAPLLEQLRLRRCDLAALCRDAAAQAERHAPQGQTLTIETQTPDICDALVEPELVRTALYNLLENAIHVSPAPGSIRVSLHAGGEYMTITVADRGPGLDAERFAALLSGWDRPVGLDEYLSYVCGDTPLGLGLPLVQRIAQLHRGSLMLSPREGGGSQLHLSLAYLPDALGDYNLHTPMILEEGYSLEELEFSTL